MPQFEIARVVWVLTRVLNETSDYSTGSPGGQTRDSRAV